MFIVVFEYLKEQKKIPSRCLQQAEVLLDHGVILAVCV